jgi:hypothetical protein
MDNSHDDRYLVFLRLDGGHGKDPEKNEEPLAECNSYEEARRVKQNIAKDCVIRFTGCAGGGD